MQVHLFDSAQQVGMAAATLIGAQLIDKPASVLGLATGSSPIPTYQELIRMHREGFLDFSSAVTFNLDEYCRLPVEHPCSYHRFMREQLFDHAEAPEHPDIAAVDVEDREILGENGVGVADSVDQRAAAAGADRGHGHHLAPLGGDAITGAVPDDDGIFMIWSWRTAR